MYYSMYYYKFRVLEKRSAGAVLVLVSLKNMRVKMVNKTIPLQAWTGFEGPGF
jgi:uncharacterized protein YejL (UPF0352 family)